MDSTLRGTRPEYSEIEDPSVPTQIFPRANDTYHTELRTWFELDSRIPRAKTELERARAICASVHGRWTHSNDDEPSRDDPITILKEASRGKRFRCVQFAQVLSGALTAFDLPARAVSLMTFDVESRESGASHVITEFWAREARKWVFADAQENAFLFRDGVPLNSAEAAQSIDGPALQVDIPGLPREVLPMYLEAFGPNFYYLETRVDQRPASGPDHAESILLVPTGALEPKIFQRKLPFENVTYTRSLTSFYRAPK